MVAIGCFFAFVIVVIAAHEISDKFKRDFFQNILYSHNVYRKIHGAPELFLSPKMCTTANTILTEWTDHHDNMEIPAKYGSNTYTINFVDDSLLNPYMIFDNWYNYNTLYDYRNEPSNPKSTDPYTQIVWRSTEKIGVGISWKDGVLKILVIYYPAGNRIGHYMSNVLDPLEVSWQEGDLNREEKLQFFEDIVDIHNIYRSYHNSPKLILNHQLCHIANIYLVEWVENRRNTLPNIYGANYSQTPFESKTDVNPKTIVISWYKNHAIYDYTKENPTDPDLTNAFTQIVWQSTLEIGVGILIVNNQTHVVVIYSPAGNQIGHYLSNVLYPREITGQIVYLTNKEKQKFFKNILNTHNIYRKYHNSPDLILNDQLCEIANTHLTEWVENRPITLPDIFGVNFSQTPFVSKPELKPKEIVKSWYKNQVFYDYTEENPTNPDQTNPFTQVVWQSTLEIGVGISILNNQTNVVVIYSPAGNQPEQYTSNVYGLSNIAEEDSLYFYDVMI